MPPSTNDPSVNIDQGNTSGNESKFRFVFEKQSTVERYRPYTDPKKIDINDQRKEGKISHKDVPEGHLAVWEQSPNTGLRLGREDLASLSENQDKTRKSKNSKRRDKKLLPSPSHPFGNYHKETCEAPQAEGSTLPPRIPLDFEKVMQSRHAFPHLENSAIEGRHYCARDHFDGLPCGNNGTFQGVDNEVVTSSGMTFDRSSDFDLPFLSSGLVTATDLSLFTVDSPVDINNVFFEFIKMD